MRNTLTAGQIATYRDQGFLVYEDLLSPQELRELTDAVLRAIEDMGDRKIMALEWRDKEEYYDSVFQQRLNLWKHNAVVRKYMLESGISALASRLSGVPMRVWHDQALSKTPWSNPTSWHLDDPYWSFSSPDAITVWIALDDATVQNGCLYYLPGSHRLVAYDNVGIGPNMGDLFRVYPRLKDIEPVPATMRAGSCVFHNGLTAHAAGPNMTPRWRRAMTCAYMPVGSVFNGNANILPEERIARLKIGDSLDDDAENPLASSLASL